jgi:DNA-directed RNA polymerase specialized sigma24 family protein
MSETKTVANDAPVYYVRNKDLIPEIEKMRDNDGHMSEELGGMLLLIAKNLSNKGNFINYTWKEDMIQEAVLTCCKYLKNFDLEKSRNPFAYITTICNHAFVNYINRQKKHSEIKDKCFNNREFVMEDDTLTLTSKAIDYTVMSKETNKKKKKKD